MLPTLYRTADRERMNHWADSVFATLSADERIGQLFMVIADPSLEARNLKKVMQFIDTMRIGGVLFSKGAPVEQAELTNRMQAHSRVPLLVALDGEWGLSMRLSGTTRFPRNMLLGAIADDSLIHVYGKEVGRQCREMGIHINFAPDIDVNSNRNNPVIGTRSFGEIPVAVADKGIAYSRGLESENVLSVAKHFPGHGDTSTDSHNVLPTVNRKREVLDSIELYPFRRYVSEGFGGIMTSHLAVPALDSTRNLPSSFSKIIITDLLKHDYGFDGLLFTDALAMKGAGGKKKMPALKDNLSVRALIAGNDILLGPSTPLTDYKAVKQAVQEGILDRKDIEEKCLKILRYKYIAGLHDSKPITIKGLEERINTPHAAWLAAKLNAEGITLLKNDSSFIPLKHLPEKKIAAISLGESKGNEFQAMLGRYDSRVTCFSLDRNASLQQQQSMYKELEAYDLVICAIHSARIPESRFLRQLSSGKREIILVFLTHPYFCAEYEKTVGSSKSVVMAYEDTPLSREYAAQLIFGGIGAKGKLPVGISPAFPAGTGIITEKTRLGYHQAEEVAMNPTTLSGIDTIALQGIKEKAYPGCRVLVARDGMIVYDKSFGYYDYTSKQPVTEQSIYDLASVTKTVGTLPAVMLTVDRSELGLDDHLGKHLTVMQGSDKEELTVRDMLYHQTGLMATLPFSTYKKAAVSDTASAEFNMEAGRNYFLPVSFRDTITEAIKKSKLSTKGKYLYSCLNFIMLQKIVEKISGESLDTLLRHNFFDPLGARTLTYNPLKICDTALIVPTEEDGLFRKQLLRGYVHDEIAAYQGGVSGNAGLFSSAGDLAKMLQLYLNQGEYGGERYLSESTVKLFTESRNTTSRRGLGFDKPDIHNHRSSPCGDLAPASVYGHTGYTGTCFWVDPDNRLLYIFLSNRVNPTRENGKLSSLNIRTRIQDTIYRASGK
jgi:beta-glucosidase-like glycosyl hydrolase/CubicO group peptidase (beta-lactamase class C family)